MNRFYKICLLFLAAGFLSAPTLMAVSTAKQPFAVFAADSVAKKKVHNHCGPKGTGVNGSGKPCHKKA